MTDPPETGIDYGSGATGASGLHTFTSGERLVGSLGDDVRYLAGVYGNASIPHRLHVLIRRVTCPFDRIIALVPEHGFHIDAGCGHGVLPALLHRSRPGTRILGTDIDRRKIEQARRAAMTGVSFTTESLGCVPGGSADSLTMVDVLYLMPDPRKAELLNECAEAMKPGAVLVVKDLVTEPRWKHRFISFQEFLMVRVLRATKGQEVRISSTATLAQIIEKSGFHPPEVHLMHRGYPYPHVCFVSRRREE